jgi:apolipoprotein N-acyltransferase
MARMRAMESGRALIRASNNGLSALISAEGKLLTVAAQFQPDTVRGSLIPMAGITPYVRLGNLPIVLLSVLVIAGSFLKRFWYRTA